MKFNYSNVIQSLAEQDIEMTSYGNIESLLAYMVRRLDLTFNGVYVMFVTNENNTYKYDEYPSVVMTRSFNHVHQEIRDYWLKKDAGNIYNLFEFNTYGEAIEFVKNYVETSSIAINK